MTKKEAIALFEDVKELADALGCTREAIYQWPENLSDGLKNKVIGAAYQKGKLK